MQASPPDPAPQSSEIARVERRAVVLLVMVSALILGFLLYVMLARGVFESTQELILVADDSEGVIVGMDLTFSGFPIGRVRRIELNAEGKARLVIDVPRKDAHWLRISSIFTLERGMVGDTRLRAFTGMLQDPPLPEHAERTVLRGDTNAEIPRIVAAARSLLENLQSMTGPESNLNTGLANLNTTSARLNGRYGMLSAALGSDEQAKKVIDTLDRTNSLLAKADQRLFGARGVMDNTQTTIAQLGEVLKDVRASLQKVDAVLVEAQGVAANARVASTDLGLLRAEVETSLRRVSQLVEEVNRKWPFARDTQIQLP